MKGTNVWIDEIHENSRYGLLGEILVKKKTAYQEIIIMKTEKYGNALMLDGCWMTSDKEEKYYHECLVHPALSSLKSIKNILVIGGGDGGTARECLKYKGVEHLDLVEIDKDVIELSKKYLKKINLSVWDDKRLKIHYEDGNQWIKKANDNYYDAIFVDGSDPSEFSQGLFSAGFYKECKRALKDHGIFSTQSESPEAFTTIHVNIIKSIKQVFNCSSTMYSFVPFYPSGIWSWTFASNEKQEFLTPKSNEINSIESNCEIWSLDFQLGAFKMIPKKIIKKLS